MGIKIPIEDLPETPEALPIPDCPGCGAGIERPKCLFEMGRACPRHEIYAEWKRLQMPYKNCGKCGAAHQGYSHDSTECRDRLLAIMEGKV